MKIKSLGRISNTNNKIHFFDKYGIDTIAEVYPGAEMIHVRTRNAEGIVLDGVTKQNNPDLIGHIMRAHNFMIDHVGSAGAINNLFAAFEYNIL